MTRRYSLWATINEVHDGDTFYGPVDQGIGIVNTGLNKSGMGLRLYGCNARELEDVGGKEARDNLARLVPPGSTIQITSVDWDKWNGRIDVLIDLPGIGDLTSHLIAQQWAMPYFGKGPKLVPPWPRTIAQP